MTEPEKEPPGNSEKEQDKLAPKNDSEKISDHHESASSSIPSPSQNLLLK